MMPMQKAIANSATSRNLHMIDGMSMPFVGGFILGDTFEVLSATTLSFILFPPRPL